MSKCCSLLQWGDKIVDRRILTDYFACDLTACHGVCCEAGDAGAPLTTEEMGGLLDALPYLRPYLSSAHLALLDEKGVGEREEGGGWVTPCHPISGACAYSFVEKGCCLCAIERAERGGALPPSVAQPLKPLSCALYPIRLRRSGAFTLLRYEEWSICDAARARGAREGIHVYEFLRAPLIRAFGAAFYSWLASLDSQE